MRLRTLALVAVLVPTAACGGGTDKKTSCDNIKKAITSIGESPQLQATGTNAAANFSTLYLEAAKKIRTAVEDAEDKKVKTAGLDVATALDSLGKSTAATGTSDAGKDLAASEQLTKAAAVLEEHCGPMSD